MEVIFLQYASFSLSEKSSILIPPISIKVNVYPSFVCKQLLRISFTFIISFAVIISTAFSSVCSLFFFLLIVGNRYTPPARASATIKIISCCILSSLFYRCVTMSHRTLLSHRTLRSHLFYCILKSRTRRHSFVFSLSEKENHGDSRFFYRRDLISVL